MKQIIKAVLLFGVIAALMFLAMSFATARLSLSFLGFRQDPDRGRVAIFRATNSTSRSFSYLGFTAADPVFSYRVLEEGVWNAASRYSCTMGASLQELPPHSTIDFKISSKGLADRYAVGVRF